MSLAENIEIVRERIAEACLRSGRDVAEVKLVAVSKTVDAAKIEEAVAAGVTLLGENRVQEAWQKYQQVRGSAEWHMIGHLQTNKVKRALQFARVIQSVDSVRLAVEIDRQAKKLDRSIDVLLQVNTSGEASKFGLSGDFLLPAAEQIAELTNVRVRGLMTIGAFTTDESRVRSCFVTLRDLREQLVQAGVPNCRPEELSMGMTDDFEWAIEEGSTMVRIGRLIFGERN